MTNSFKVLYLIFVLVSLSEESVVKESDSGDNSQIGNVSLSPQEEAALKNISVGAKSFASKFHSAVAKKDGNLVMSPLSLQMVLALAFVGAKGTTASELATLLSLPSPCDNITLVGHQSLIRVVQDPALSLANRMFVELSATVKDSFQKIAEEYFYSPAESLDFQKSPEKSRQYINAWVENKTNGRISDLLSSDAITADTQFVLTNAVYFKANWKTKFDENKTKEETFSISNTEQVQVQMMNTKSKFYFYHDNELAAKFLRMSYDSEKFDMIVVLPDDVEGLSDVESKLKNIDIVYEKVNLMASTTVDVHLPKFKIEKSIELNSIMISMGVPTMFGRSADFGGISDVPLAVSSVLQKVFIEVNEHGTEAAAATAVVGNMITSIGEDEPREETFVANNPFMFIITLKSYDIPIFWGRYAVPK